MAIVFEKQKKTQRNLILILTVVLVITVVIIWQGFSEEEAGVSVETPTVFAKKEIKINFNVLADPLLEELQPFSETKPFEEATSTPGKPGLKLGRENPFVPY